MYRILVIEDEEDIQEILRNYLTAEGYEVAVAGDGVEGITRFHSGSFDLILLDVMMPKIDGFGTCELIRRESDVPIIMLTALDEEEYQIRGLDLKADDYITKPFSAPVLMRKIAAVLRRSHKEESQQEIYYRGLRLDLAGHRVFVQEDGAWTEAELTQKEFELLHVLLINKGLVLTRQKLLNLVWDEDYFGEERIVDTHIKNLRKKLGQNYITTIRGVGYRVDKENEKQSYR
ncbi:MAG: response regulator transcription factor [Lachnospiraceae bacterium]|nr:response regulator transcription factor [Lachnospiraceae bacterium]